MPVNNFAFAVGTAATQIAWPASTTKYVYVQNSDYDGSSEIYVGGSGVATTDGIRVWRDQNMVFEINADDSFYAICTAGTGSVRVIEVR